MNRKRPKPKIKKSKIQCRHVEVMDGKTFEILFPVSSFKRSF